MAIDESRLMNVMSRAEAGEELVIGFLGGSITQGSLSSSADTCYAALVYQWWVKMFSKATFHYVNAGIGGTDSLYGVSRAPLDLLMYRPDVVVMDFSVNDAADTAHVESYEGAVRRVLSAQSKPAVVLLCNARYDNGDTAEAAHRLIAEYYGLPVVSIKDGVYSKILAGEYTTADLSPDGLHPNDKGHSLVAGEVIKYLESVRVKAAGKECRVNTRDLPQPFTSNTWENARRLTIANTSPVLNGFRADAAEKMGHLDHFKNGWIGAHRGDWVTFRLENVSNIAVQYRKTIKLPACKANCTIVDPHGNNGEGEIIDAIELDGNFEETWGDCLYLDTMLLHGKRGTYEVDITVTEDGDGKECTPFYLMSLVVA